jgi:membrane-associated protease RseP (regulator of RpoE activity)
MITRNALALFVLAASTALAVPPAATPTAALGLLVDSASAERANDGLPVLGATPGSIADELGLRPGDLVVEVNGTSLANLGADADGHALAAATFNSSIATLPPAAPLRLRVLRNGVALAMNAPLHDAAMNAQADVPAASAMVDTDSSGGCGRISTFDVAPRSNHQYHAKILLLDGVTPGPTGHETYRVSAGTHTLLVAENIPTEEMGVGDFATLRSRRDTSKKLTVTVKANTTAMLAAQLHIDKASVFTHAAYWDPVIWREIPERCP